MVSLHKINKLVCFAAPLNTRQAYDLRHSIRASTNISTVLLDRVARATFDASFTLQALAARIFFGAHVNG